MIKPTEKSFSFSNVCIFTYTGISVLQSGTTEFKDCLAVWAKQRTILVLTFSGSINKQFYITIGDKTFTYTIIRSGRGGWKTQIELTGMLDGADELVISAEGVSGSYPLSIAHVGIADPAMLAIPYNGAVTDTYRMLPPSTIYADGVHELMLDMVGYGIVYLNDSSIDVSPTLQYIGVSLGAIAADSEVRLSYEEISPIRDIVLLLTRTKEIPCGVTSAYIQWQGVSGGSKAALWKVRDMGAKVTESVNFATMSCGVDVRKSFNNQLTLYLDDLCAYDVWYYSDIIVSDSVVINSRKVKVTTSSIAYPNGYDRGEIVVDVEFSDFNL